jgi:translation initiation factor IF-1
MARRHFKKKTGKDSSKEEGVELTGAIVENLPNAQFRVRIDDTDQIVLAYISGKMRRHYIRLMEGDRVRMVMSPYDVTRARITFRLDNRNPNPGV